LRFLIPAAIACTLLPVAWAQYGQQGGKIVGTGQAAPAGEGWSVGLSADGSTAMVAGPTDGAGAWAFTRANGAWSQQGGRFPFTPFSSNTSVAVSADGNFAVVGCGWFTRANGIWSQLGLLFNPSGITGSCTSVSLSADGNTAIVAGFSGVAVLAHTNPFWSVQGTLLGTGAVGFPSQGFSVAISGDGNTAIVGDAADFTNTGAVWIFARANGVWSQQGNKLVGTGATGPALQGSAVALSADGNTAIVGGFYDNSNTGASWIFTRTNGVWTQQGGKLVGAGAIPGSPSPFGLYLGQGGAVAISGDGNTAVVGADNDNNLTGAAWIFTRANGVWSQSGGKLVGSGAVGQSLQGASVAISADGSTVMVGGKGDNNYVGAVWVYVTPAPPPMAPSSLGVAPPAGSGTTGTLAFTFADTGGWQDLSVVDVLIRDVLDGRQACYVAFVPSTASSGSVFLVDDTGDAGGPYSGMVLPGSGSVFNSQCSITGAGSSVVANGSNGLTLTLALTFAPGFAGNKVIYMAARDATANSGWQVRGTWNVPGAPATGPAVSGVSPTRGAGSQAYTFTFTDTNGWQDLSVVDVLINSAINGVKACYVAFVASGASSGTVYLVDDAGDSGGSFAGPYAAMLLPGSSTVNNRQCTINGSGSTVAASGNTLTLTLSILFSQTFAGDQVVYAAARSNTQNSGWQAVGTISVQ